MNQQYPVITIREERIGPFTKIGGTQRGPDYVAMAFEEARQKHAGKTVEIKFPELFISPYYKELPTPKVFIGPQSKEWDIKARLQARHTIIGPDCVDLADIVRESKIKLEKLKPEIQAIDSDAARTFITILDGYQAADNPTIDDIKTLHKTLDNLFSHLPHFSASDYLKGGTEARPELDEAIKNNTLKTLVNRAENILEGELGLLKETVSRESVEKHNARIKEEENAKSEAQKTASEKNSISSEAAAQNYFSIIREICNGLIIQSRNDRGSHASKQEIEEIEKALRDNSQSIPNRSGIQMPGKIDPLLTLRWLLVNYKKFDPWENSIDNNNTLTKSIEHEKLWLGQIKNGNGAALQEEIATSDWARKMLDKLSNAVAARKGENYDVRAWQQRLQGREQKTLEWGQRC